LRRNSVWIARVSASVACGSSSSIALRCKGRVPPPSRNEPADATASMIRFGATVHVTRHPG
jgi:hypothetical protein